MIRYPKENGDLQDLASALLDLLGTDTRAAASCAGFTAGGRALAVVPALLDVDNGVDGHLENPIHSAHLFAATFHI